MVHGVEQEDGRDRPVRGRALLVRLVFLDADRLRKEEDEHSRAGGQEEEPPPELVNEGGYPKSQRKFKDREIAVNKELDRDADLVQCLVEVVRRQAVSRPL